MYDNEIAEIKQIKKDLEDKLSVLQKVYEGLYEQNFKLVRRVKELERKCKEMGM